MASVLIVDDSATMRRIISRSIRQSGLPFDTIIEAENGQDGLEKLAANSVDLVLTDINMPVMNGLDFVRNVRAQKAMAGLPIVVISTESGKEFVVEAVKLGAKGFIKKPFTPKTLAAKLKPLLG